MSLRDAVLEVVEQMENDRSPELLMYARQLRLLVKAADNAPPVSVQEHYRQRWQGMDDSKGRQQLEKWKQVEKQAEAEESFGMRMVDVQGGRADGVMAPISSAMPVGARTLIDKEVYQLRADGKLHFDADMTRETERLRKDSLLSENPSV